MVGGRSDRSGAARAVAPWRQAYRDLAKDRLVVLRGMPQPQRPGRDALLRLSDQAAPKRAAGQRLIGPPQPHAPVALPRGAPAPQRQAGPRPPATPAPPEGPPTRQWYVPPRRPITAAAPRRPPGLRLAPDAPARPAVEPATAPTALPPGPPEADTGAPPASRDGRGSRRRPLAGWARGKAVVRLSADRAPLLGDRRRAPASGGHRRRSRPLLARLGRRPLATRLPCPHSRAPATAGWSRSRSLARGSRR